jgi:hypothetical protein
VWEDVCGECGAVGEVVYCIDGVARCEDCWDDDQSYAQDDESGDYYDEDYDEDEVV